MAVQGMYLTWIVVKDLDQAIQFYSTVLGLTLKEHSPEFGWAELEGKSGNRLGLAIEQKEANDWDPLHLKAGSNGVVTIAVDNLAESSADYAKKGVQFIGKVMEVPGEVKMQTCKDPDGNLFQLVELLRVPLHK